MKQIHVSMYDAINDVCCAGMMCMQNLQMCMFFSQYFEFVCLSFNATLCAHPDVSQS